MDMIVRRAPVLLIFFKNDEVALASLAGGSLFVQSWTKEAQCTPRW